MTLRYSDLEAFCADLLDMRKGSRDIGIFTLKHNIAKRFGISDYKIKNIMKSLIEYGFIERTGMSNRFKIIYLLEKPKEKTEAEKEADDLLEKIEGG